MREKRIIKVTARPGTLDIVINRDFDAPPELLFRAYTDPKLFARWWGAEGMSTIVETFEPRAGASYRYRQRIEGHGEFTVHGVYHSVTPTCIVKTFEAEPMPGHVLFETVTFTSLAGRRTQVTTQSLFQSVSDRDAMIRSGVEEGTSFAFASLDELLCEMKVKL